MGGRCQDKMKETETVSTHCIAMDHFEPGKTLLKLVGKL